MGISNLLENGIARIRTETYDTQRRFLQVVADARRMPVKAIELAGGVFIPNDNFLVEFCGEEIKEEQYGCYTGDNCVWSNYVIFPIRNVANVIVGVAGFEPFDYLSTKETNNYDLHYYSYSNKSVFPKGYYLYCPNDDFNHALDDGYLLIVDGLFDAISLAYAGFNAAALMGSVLTPQILMQLRVIKKIVLLADNDEAGYKLFAKMKKHLPNVVLVKQGKTKDVDELLKSEFKEKFIQKVWKIIQSGILPIETIDFC